jgi:hypothetical protein
MAMVIRWWSCSSASAGAGAGAGADDVELGGIALNRSRR